MTFKFEPLLDRFTAGVEAGDGTALGEERNWDQSRFGGIAREESGAGRNSSGPYFLYVASGEGMFGEQVVGVSTTKFGGVFANQLCRRDPLIKRQRPSTCTM